MITEIGRLTQDVKFKTVATEKGEVEVLNNRFAIQVNKNLNIYIDN